MVRTTNLERLQEEAEQIGLKLSQAQLQALSEYHQALYAANAVMNLTRVAEPEAWVRHYLDSVLFEDLIPAGSRVLDIGTGPGLPAWPLACCRPDLSVTAIDSNGKMLGFLRTMRLPNLEVIQVRAEEWDRREEFDVVTGRAVAPLPAQLELSAAFAEVGGCLLPMRTPQDDPELPDVQVLGIDLESVVDRPLPGTDVVRRFPVYRKNATTPRRFPRRWAEIKAKPL